MNKLVPLCAAAAAIVAAAIDASAVECRLAIPSPNFTVERCPGVPPGNIDQAGVRVLSDRTGTVWTYAVNLEHGISASAMLINSDGSFTKSSATGHICGTAADQTATPPPQAPNPGPNVSCQTAAQFLPNGLPNPAAPVKVRVLL